MQTQKRCKPVLLQIKHAAQIAFALVCTQPVGPIRFVVARPRFVEATPTAPATTQGEQTICTEKCTSCIKTELDN